MVGATAETVVAITHSRGCVRVRLRTMTAEIDSRQAQALALVPGSAVLARVPPTAVRLIPRPP